MSASAMVDALIYLYSAASLFGANNVGKEVYDVLEKSSGSCLVVSVVGLKSDNQAGFGGRQHWWQYQLDAFIKDTGDPFAFKNRSLLTVDNVVKGIESDFTIQGTAVMIGDLQMARETDRAIVTTGGLTYYQARFLLSALEYV